MLLIIHFDWMVSYRLERRVRVWENIGCVASVSSRVIARKLEISSQRSRRTRAETLATQARENTSRSGEVEETFTVILKNASPPPPLRPHPRHFPTSNSASIYLSCLYAERLSVGSISGGWVWAHFPEQRLVIEPRLTGEQYKQHLSFFIFVTLQTSLVKMIYCTWEKQPIRCLCLIWLINIRSETVTALPVDFSLFLYLRREALSVSRCKNVWTNGPFTAGKRISQPENTSRTAEERSCYIQEKNFSLFWWVSQNGHDIVDLSFWKRCFVCLCPLF